MTTCTRLRLHQSVVDLALNQILKLKPLETMISIRSSTICGFVKSLLKSPKTAQQKDGLRQQQKHEM